MVKPQICFSHRYKYAVAVTVCFFLYIWHNPTQNISVICNQYAEIQSFTMYCDQADNRRSPPGCKRIISSVHNPDFNLSTRRKMQTLPFSTQRKQVTSWGEGQWARGRRAARKRWKAPLICSAISETRESVVQEDYWPHKFTLPDSYFWLITTGCCKAWVFCFLAVNGGPRPVDRVVVPL